ncbi:hypothetical protein [Pleurocapsa sp. PCC 7319]|uniref:TRAFAC clade GTPase domain-containing protein n=1 Tax=Pleurocapsa sp. PCC 7319 TaxID=118161 RepID=UPI0003487426|nr:hypothetical protein [Pleurocapsa sp. PCC 7319]
MTSPNWSDFSNRLQSYTKIFTEKFNEFKENLQASPRNIRLGIWGTTGAGKTTYLTMLYDALELSGNWWVEVNPNARSFLEYNLDTIKEERKFPEPTEPGELEIYSYILRPKSPRVANSEIILNFIDAPGEFYENIQDTKGKVIEDEESREKDIVDYLIACDGIIFLLDPIRSKKDNKTYSTLLRKLFQEFQERSRSRRPRSESNLLEQYMAFCVTKFDREELWNKGDESDKLAENVMGWELQRLQNFCRLELDRETGKNKPSKENRCEFFSVSSIGRYQDKDGKSQVSVIEPAQTSNSNSQEKSKSNQQLKKGYDFDDDTPSQPINTNPSSSSSKCQPTIKSDVTLNSYNVLEPVEWLIQRIQNHPPSRPNTSNSPKQN